MARTAKTCRGAGRSRTSRLGRLVLLGLALSALAACEAEDLDVRKAMMPEVAGPIPGTTLPYPNLASVPAAPTATAPAARAALQKKLEADNKATTYTPDRAAAPQLPSPPPALPKGFVEAEQPVKLADAAAAPPAGPAGNAPSSAVLGAARRVAIVFFAEGSSEIDPRQVAKLRPLAESVRRQGGRLELVGHAEREGETGGEVKLDDFDLSVTRGNAVARALVRLGLTDAELSVTAEGDSAPVASLAGLSGAAANRRVDVFYEN